MNDDPFNQLLELSKNLGESLKIFSEKIEVFFDIPIVKMLKLIGIIITIILFIIWIILIRKTNKIADSIEKYKFYQATGKKEKKHSLKVWKNIEKLIESDNEESMKQGFILMNELLNEVLNRVTLAGNDAIEKIKNLRIAEFNESDKSKLLVGIYAYNKIVENPSFALDPKEIKYFLKLYKQFFVIIGFLEE